MLVLARYGLPVVSYLLPLLVLEWQPHSIYQSQNTTFGGQMGRHCGQAWKQGVFGVRLWARKCKFPIFSTETKVIINLLLNIPSCQFVETNERSWMLAEKRINNEWHVKTTIGIYVYTYTYTSFLAILDNRCKFNASEEELKFILLCKMLWDEWIIFED